MANQFFNVVTETLQLNKDEINKLSDVKYAKRNQMIVELGIKVYNLISNGYINIDDFEEDQEYQIQENLIEKDQIQKKIEQISNDKEIWIKKYYDLLVEKNQTMISANIGQAGELEVEKEIMRLRPDIKIENVSHLTERGDRLIIYDDVNIMIEVKKYKNTVYENEVCKFKKALECDKYDSGIMISINSSISGKRDFTIDWYKGKPCIYMHGLLHLEIALEMMKIMVQKACIDNDLFIESVKTTITLFDNRVEAIENSKNLLNDLLLKSLKEVNNLDKHTTVMLSELKETMEKYEIQKLNSWTKDDIKKIQNALDYREWQPRGVSAWNVFIMDVLKCDISYVRQRKVEALKLKLKLPGLTWSPEEIELIMSNLQWQNGIKQSQLKELNFHNIKDGDLEYLNNFLRGSKK
jgi:hypothetical protein